MTLRLSSCAFATALVAALMSGLSPVWAKVAAPHSHAHSPSRAAKAAPSPAASYTGRFTSECDKLAEGLYTQDIVDLQPLAPQRIQAQYHKALYTEADCALSARLGTLHLPLTTWQIDGAFKVGKSTAHRVTVQMPAGLITTTVDQADKVKETDKAWVLSIGAEQVPIEKASDAMLEKDMRLIENGVLYFGDPGSPDAQGYPQEALRNHPMKRTPTP
jgi:hypothetical protein